MKRIYSVVVSVVDRGFEQKSSKTKTIKLYLSLSMQR